MPKIVILAKITKNHQKWLFFDQKITFLVFGDLLITYNMFWNHFSRFGYVFCGLKFFSLFDPKQG